MWIMFETSLMWEEDSTSLIIPELMLMLLFQSSSEKQAWGESQTSGNQLKLSAKSCTSCVVSST